MRPADVRGSEVPEPPSDEVLLERFLQGDIAAFESLLERYRRPMYNFVLRSVRDPQTAEDLLQETFLRVVQRSDDFRRESKFSTWIYTIARNLVVDHGRRMAFRRHASLDAPSRGETEGAPLVERTAGDSPSAERESIGREAQVALRDAIDALPDEQREVFLLRQVQGLAFQEIAQIVGTSENTTKSRMRYALERLQEALSEYRDYASKLS
jgi:RNA polymerase sigma-70 factor (ECF subfamily)